MNFYYKLLEATIPHNNFWNIDPTDASKYGQGSTEWITEYNNVTNIIFGKVVLGLLIACVIVSIIYITIAFIKIQTNHTPENITNFKKRLIWTLLGLSVVILAQTALPYIVKKVYENKKLIDNQLGGNKSTSGIVFKEKYYLRDNKTYFYLE